MDKNKPTSWRLLVASLLISICAACAASPNPMLTATSIPNHSLNTVLPPRVNQSSTIQATGTSVPGPSISATPSLEPLNFANPQTAILVKNLANPDDLAAGPNGALFISDISSGLIYEISPGSPLQKIVSGLSVPEGMIYLPTGSLIIAEQGKNRLLKFDLSTGKLADFFNLTNTTNQEGVDGIAIDAGTPNGDTIVIPDSPNGVLRRVGLGGDTMVVLARGFIRPTGAWVEPGGNILVVDEAAGYLYRVHPDGKKDQLARFSTPDDVIEDSSGNIFINTLGDHAVHALTPGGRDIVLLNNISDPQGIAFTGDGNLVVTDPVNHQLIEIFIHDHS